MKNKKDEEYNIIVILTIFVTVLIYSLIYTGIVYINKREAYIERIKFLEQKIEYLEGEKYKYEEEKADKDIRFGCVAFGIEIKEETKDEYIYKIYNNKGIWH